MSEYFPKPNMLGANVKVKLHLSNYAAKRDSKDLAGVDTSNFAKKADLAELKSDVDELDIDQLKFKPKSISSLKSTVRKLDIGKLETTLVCLSKLSNVTKREVIKKSEYDELVKKDDGIQTTYNSNLVKNLTITQKLMKLEKRLLILIMLLNNLVS